MATKFQTLGLLGLLAVASTSCRKQASPSNDESSNETSLSVPSGAGGKSPFLGIRTHESTHPESVIYYIVSGEEPDVVSYAFFGDGTHKYVGFTIPQSGSDKCLKVTMEDQKSKERWNFSVALHEQVIVRPDRSLQRIHEFVKFENGGLTFGKTDDPILNAAAKEYAGEMK